MTLEHWVFDARDSPPARTPDLPAMRGSIPALLATPSRPPCAVIIKEVLCVPSMGAAVALTMLFGPLGLLKHGNDAKYPAGTKATVYTDQQITVKVVQ
jgi:hypothetical protein